jgi:hypothetical protein
VPISKVADRATVNSNSAVTTADYALSGLTVGNVLIIRTAAENTGGGGAARTVTVTNQSGTAIDLSTDQAFQANVDPGAAGAGATCNVIVALITATSGTVRLTYSGSVRQAGVAEEWTGIDTTTNLGIEGSEVTATGTASTTLVATSGSLATASPMTIGNMAYVAVAVEGPSGDTYTQDSDTVGGAWQDLTKAGTTNATATDNMTTYGGYKVVNTDGQTQTYNNATINNARDSAGILLEFITSDKIADPFTIVTTTGIGVATIPQPAPVNPGVGEDASPYMIPFDIVDHKYAAIWRRDTGSLAGDRRFQLWSSNSDDTMLWPSNTAATASSGLGMDAESHAWRQSPTQVGYLHSEYHGGANLAGVRAAALAYNDSNDTMANGGFGSDVFQPVDTSGAAPTLSAFGCRMADDKALISCIQQTSDTVEEVRVKVGTLASSSSTTYSLGTGLDLGLPNTNAFIVRAVGLSDTRAVAFTAANDGSTTSKLYGQLLSCTSGTGTTLATIGSWTALSDDYMPNIDHDFWTIRELDSTRFMILWGGATSNVSTDRFLKARIIDTTGDTFTLGTVLTLETISSTLASWSVMENHVLLGSNKTFITAQRYTAGAGAPTFGTIASNTVVAGNSMTITKPASTVDNEFLWTFFAIDGDTGSVTITPPSGWLEHETAINSGNVGLRSYYKQASSEGANYVWGFSTNVTAVGACVRMTGSSADVSPWTSVNTGTSTNPTLAHNISGDTMIAVSGTDTDVAHTAPTGFTERLDTGAGSTVRLSIATDTNIGTGGSALSFTASSTNWATLQVATPAWEGPLFGYILDYGASGTTVTVETDRTQMLPRISMVDVPNPHPSFLTATPNRITFGAAVFTPGAGGGTVYDIEPYGFLDVPSDVSETIPATVIATTSTVGAPVISTSVQVQTIATGTSITIPTPVVPVAVPVATVATTSQVGGVNYDPRTAIAWHSVFWADDPDWTNPGDGNAIAQWDDGGGNGLHLTQSTGALRPIFRSSVAEFNNRGGVDPDGADLLSTVSTTLPQPFSIVAVVVPEDIWDVRPLVDSGSVVVYAPVSNHNLAFDAGSGVVQSPPNTYLGYAAHLVVWHFDGASSFIEMDGTSVATGNPGTSGISGVINLFQAHTGPAAFIAFYDGDVTADPGYADLEQWVNWYYFAVGSPPVGVVISTGSAVATTTIVTASQVGVPVTRTGITHTATTVATSSTVGVPTISTGSTHTATTIATTSTVGTPNVAVPVRAPTVATVSAVGAPVVSAGSSFTVTTIATNSTVGVPTVGGHSDVILGLPTFVGAGALAAAATGNTLVPALPAGWAVGDVAILQAKTNLLNSWNAPVGWTEFASNDNVAGLSSSLFWRRLEAGDTDPTVEIIGSGNSITASNGHYARIYAFRGCAPTGTPVEGVVTRTVLEQAVMSSEVTTSTEPHSLIVWIGGFNNDISYFDGMRNYSPDRWSPIGTAVTSTVGGDAMFDAQVARRSTLGTEPSRILSIQGVTTACVSFTFGLIGTSRVLHTTTTVGVPTINTSTDATVPAAVVATTSAVGVPVTQTGSRVTAIAIATSSTVPAITFSALATPAPLVVATSSAVGVPLVKTGATPTPPVVATVSQIGVPSIPVSIPVATISTHSQIVYESRNSLEFRNVNFETALVGDTTEIDITGDLDVWVDLAMDDWTAPTGDFGVNWFAGRWSGTGGRQWGFLIGNEAGTLDGNLLFIWTTDGTTQNSVVSTIAVPFPNGKRVQVRATMDVDNGASGNTVTFYYRYHDSDVWTQLGDSVVTAGVTSISTAGTPALTLGVLQEGGYQQEKWTGRLYRFELRDGINGTVVANPDFTAQSVTAPGGIGSMVSFTDGAGRTWEMWHGLRIAAKGISTGSTHTTTTVATTSTVGVPATQTGATPTPPVVVTTTAVGVPTFSMSAVIPVVAVATVSTVGTPGLNQTVPVVTVATTSTVGVPVVQTGSTVTTTVIATSSTVGVPVVETASGTTVSAVAVDTVSTVGVPVVATGATPTPPAVATVSTVGVPTVLASSTHTSTAAVATVSAVGVPSILAVTTISPAAVVTVSTVGVPVSQAGSTATPPAVVTVSAVGVPTLSTGSTVTTTAVSTSSTVGVPVAQTGSTVAPSVVATASTVGTPTVSGTVAIPVVAVATTSTVGVPTISAGATVTTVAVVTASQVGVPTFSTGSTHTTTTVVTSSAVGVPSINTGSTLATSPVATTTTVGVPTVSGTVAVPAVVVVTTSQVGVPVLSAGSTVTTIAVDTVSTVGVPSIQTSGNANVAATVVATTTAIDAPTISASADVPAVVVATTSLVGVPTVSGTVQAPQTTVATVSTLDAPTISASTTATPGAVSTASTVGVPTVLTQTGAAPETIITSSTVGVPTIDTSNAATATPLVVATLSSVGVPVLSTGSQFTTTAVNTASTVGVPSVGAGSTVITIKVDTVTSIGSPSVINTGTATPPVVATSSAVGAPSLSTSSTFVVSPVATTAQFDVVTVSAGARPEVVAVITVTGIGTPSMSTTSVLTPATVGTTSVVGDASVVLGGSGNHISIALTILVSEQHLTVQIQSKDLAPTKTDMTVRPVARERLQTTTVRERTMTTETVEALEISGP